MPRRLPWAASALALFFYLLLTPAAWRAAGLSPHQFMDCARVLAAAPWPGEGVRMGALLLQHLAALGWWGLLLLGGLGSARWLAREAPGVGARAEAALLYWGGLGVLIFLLFAAHLGAWVAPLSFVALLVPAVACVREYLKATRRLPCSDAWEWTLLVLAALPAALALLSAPMPVHQSDALAYHAAVPRAYVLAGRLVDFPYNIRAHFPMLAEMLSAPGLALGIESAPRLVHVAFFWISLLLVYDLAAGWTGRRSGLWAAAAFGGVAYAPGLAAYGFVDFATAAYFLAAVRELTRLARQENPTAASLFRLAVLCGMAAATKLSIALSLLPLPVAAAVILLRARPLRAAMPVLALAALLGAAPLLPWWVHNGVVAGNPFLPFLARTFPSPRWTPTDAALYHAHAREKGGLAHGLRALDLVSLPWRAATAPMRNRPELSGHPERWMGDWPIGPLATAALPLLVLLLVPGTPRGPRAGALFSLWLALVWAATYRDLRFLLPFLGVWFPTLAAALGQSQAGFRGPAALTLPPLLVQTAMGVLLSLLATAAPTAAGRAPLGYVLGFVSRDALLRDKIPDSFTPALDWLAAHRRPDERALLVGLNQAYPLPYDCVVGDFFSTCPLLAWAEVAQNVAGLEARLAAERVTSVVFVGENLANPAYAFWFFQHLALEPSVQRYFADRSPSDGFQPETTPAYQLVSAWLAASPHLSRVYPPAAERLAPGAGPWGLPARTVIYRPRVGGATEAFENTRLK